MGTVGTEDGPSKVTCKFYILGPLLVYKDFRVTPAGNHAGVGGLSQTKAFTADFRPRCEVSRPLPVEQIQVPSRVVSSVLYWSLKGASIKFGDAPRK